MQLMVYAPYGRTGIYMIQEYCRLLGVDATEEELRDLGMMIGALSADHPIAGVVNQAKDFRNPDALADALLHPQDRATPCRSFTPGSSVAACHSGAGSTRLPSGRNAGQ